jgi:hypothetical protein
LTPDEEVKVYLCLKSAAGDDSDETDLDGFFVIPPFSQNCNETEESGTDESKLNPFLNLCLRQM